MTLKKPNIVSFNKSRLKRKEGDHRSLKRTKISRKNSRRRKSVFKRLRKKKKTLKQKFSWWNSRLKVTTYRKERKIKSERNLRGRSQGKRKKKRWTSRRILLEKVINRMRYSLTNFAMLSAVLTKREAFAWKYWLLLIRMINNLRL